MAPPPSSAPQLDLEAAREAVRAVVGDAPTPLVRAPDLDGRAGRPVWLKLESLQATGSFKVRGAAAHLTALPDDARRRGVVTCSSGNHGRAVAFVAERLGIDATVCVPTWVDPTKLEAIRGHGAEAVLVGDTYDEAEEHALSLARERERTFVPPFDDEAVAAGQGTIALEILEQLPRVFEVAVPLSGGGLAGGIGWALAHRARRPVHVSAVSAAAANVMLESVFMGRPLEPEQEEETLATALSGGIGGERNRVTFELVRRFVHDHYLATEREIALAMSYAYRSGLRVEGGGAVALASVLAQQFALPEHPARGERALVVIVSGGNVDLALLRELASDTLPPYSDV